jgi:hypothetical protein
MARVKRWLGVVLEPQLDCLSRCFASNLGHHLEAEVDSRSDAARGYDVAVLDDAGFLMGGTYQRQQLGKSPVFVARRPFSNPAAPRIKAPVHTEVMYITVLDCL